MSKDHLLPPSRSSTSKPQLIQNKAFSSRHRCMMLPRTYSMECDENTGFNKEREIREFLYTVPVVPKLPKMPDINKYLNKGKTVNRSNTINDRNSIIKNYM